MKMIRMMRHLIFETIISKPKPITTHQASTIMCVSSIDQSRRRSLGSAASELLKPTTDNTKEGTPSPVKTSKINNGAAKDILKPQQKHCVQHNYHDHALDNDATFKAQRSNVSKGGVTVPFPVKLHDMLEHIEMNEPQLTSVVSWQPHGRCFLVHKPKLFADQVLARFFQQKKYASFQRQLNLYGFNRITKGPDRGSYYHELFLRGKKFLCKGINRMKIKGTGARMASNPDAEPDFYKMKPLEAGAVGDENIAKVVSSNTMVDTEPVKSESGAMPPLRIQWQYLPPKKTNLIMYLMTCHSIALTNSRAQGDTV